MAKPFLSIPGPRGLPIIGSVLDYTSLGPFSYELMHEAKMANYRRYGPIYKTRLGRDIVELFDPKDAELVYRHEGELPARPALPICSVAFKRDKIKLGFGNLNGATWWRIRKAVAPCMLKPDAVVPFLQKQLNVAGDFVKLIDETRGRREKVSYANLLELLKKFSIEAYGSICFNVRLGCLKPEVPLSSDAHVIMTSSAAMFEAVQKTMFSFPTYAFYRTPLYTQFVDSYRTCQSLVRKYLEDSRGVADNPLLESFPANENDDNFMTADERVGICIDLFTSGVDATAFALCFLLYNLASNPEKQERLRQEIRSASVAPSSDCGGRLGQVDVSGLSYLRSCIKESFRLNFPVQGGPIRELEKDMILSNYLVPKKTLVSMNFQTMCRLERNFGQPDRFIPERWIKHRDVSLHDDHPTNQLPSSGHVGLRHNAAFSFLPFGYGRRMCTGRRFAEQQIALALFKVLQSYKLETTTKDLGMINRIFTMPDKDVQITFVPVTS